MSRTAIQGPWWHQRGLKVRDNIMHLTVNTVWVPLFREIGILVFRIQYNISVTVSLFNILFRTYPLC